jgi:hypothetical protein
MCLVTGPDLGRGQRAVYPVASNKLNLRAVYSGTSDLGAGDLVEVVAGMVHMVGVPRGREPLMKYASPLYVRFGVPGVYPPNP